jgi:type IV pilus assembly protein PilN
MIKINLFPVREVERKRETVSFVVTRGGAIIFFVLAIIYFGNIKIGRDLNEANDTIESLKNELKGYEKEEKELKKYKNREKKLKSKIKIIGDLEAKRSGPARILDELTKCVSEKLWLKNFKQSGNSLELDGVALDNNIIAGFMTALNNSQYFDKVVLSYIKKSKIGAVNVMNFNINCEIVFFSRRT